MKLNLEYLVEALWGHLNMVRIYTKKPGCPPDFSDPIILRNGANVKHVCHTIHRTLPDVFKYALVWVNTKKLFLYQKTQINSISISFCLFHFFQGTSTKFNPQRVGFAHIVEDEDVIQVVKK